MMSPADVMFPSRVGFLEKCRRRDFSVKVWLSTIFACIGLWVGTVVFFSFVEAGNELSGVTDTAGAWMAAIGDWFGRRSVGQLWGGTGRTGQEPLRIGDPTEVARLAIVSLLASASLSAACIFIFKYQLKYTLRPRPSSKRGTDRDSMLLVAGVCLDEQPDKAGWIDCVLLMFSGVVYATIVIFSGMIGGRTARLLNIYLDVSLLNTIFLLLFTSFTVYFLCDAVAATPTLLTLSKNIDFIWKKKLDTSRSVLVAPPAAALNVCEICRELILPGQVCISSPTSSSSVDEANAVYDRAPATSQRGDLGLLKHNQPFVPSASNCGSDCGSNSSITHYNHLLCFARWKGTTCAGCSSPLLYSSFDILDSCFAWTYITTLISVAWFVDKLGMEHGVHSLEKISALVVH